jgi:hypothetical protein
MIDTFFPCRFSPRIASLGTVGKKEPDGNLVAFEKFEPLVELLLAYNGHFTGDHALDAHRKRNPQVFSGGPDQFFEEF